MSRYVTTWSFWCKNRIELDPVWRFEQRSVLQKCHVVVLEDIIHNHLHQNEIDVGGGS